jgi:hypothetical protein
MKNQEMNIHEIIDFNEVLNQDIYPDLEEMIEDGETIHEGDLWDLIVRYTIDYDLWQETDDVWYNEIYVPMLDAIKEDFTVVEK